MPSIVEDIADVAVSEGVATVIGGLISAAAPRLNGIRLNYKYNKFESHVKMAITQLLRRVEVLEVNYNALNENNIEKFNGTYQEWLLDSLYNEKQQEKISYYVNGYINLMDNSANDNLMLMFFNTINELTQLDIDVLGMYSGETQDNIFTLGEKYNLLPEQLMVIKEKLARLGLLVSINDIQRDENIDAIVLYLDKVDKEKKKRNPREVKIPKIKKVNRHDSFRITKLGINYLKVISE